MAHDGDIATAQPAFDADKKESDEHTQHGQTAVVDTLSVVPAAHDATLEDYIFYADQQYYHNDSKPIHAIDHVQGGDHGTAHVDDVGAPPGPAIRKSPLHYLWGPASPETVTGGGGGEKVQDVVASGAVAALDEQNGDTLDRMLLRRVTMLRAFFLITTDVLGPFQGPYVYSQVGFVPGTIVYVVMGIMAYLAGINLSVLYLRVDSDVMPTRNFADLARRVWGKWGKVIVDILFLLQLVFSCAQLLLTNAQSLALIVEGAKTKADGTPVHHLCFSVMVLVFLIINILLSTIRKLKTIGFLGIVSLGLAIVACIVSTAAIFHYPPNYQQAMAAFGTPQGPVEAKAFVSLPLTSKVNGIMNMVYAYGGATVYPSVLAEMRRPWDFWKSLLYAQMIIMTIYILFGILVYAKQGQFVQSLFYFGISKYSFQTFGNAVGVYTGMIAAILYGNIAQKEVYHIVVRSVFKGPRLMSRQGYKWWLLGNVVFWCIAYVIGAAIPQVQTISGLIGAVTILQFSYSFPFLLKFCFDVQVDAMRGDRPYYGGGGAGLQSRASHRADTWLQWSRWRRGLFSGNVLSKAVFLVLSLASLSMAGLGIYGSAESIVATFNSGAAATPFGCATP